MEAIYSNYAPVFLYVNQYSFSAQWIYQENRVPYSLVRYVLSGSARFEVNGVSYEVCKDSVFYIPEGSSLYCEAHERVVFISARFLGSVQLPQEDVLHKLWNVSQLYDFGGQPDMRELFERLLNSAISKTNYKKLETRGYLNLIIAALARKACLEDWQDAVEEPPLSVMDVESIRRRAQASHVSTDPRIRVLVDYLSLNPQKNLSREEMCALCGVSESTLRRLFKQDTGKTIHDFIREARMNYAAHKLVITNEPVSSIGYELGYESSSYFTKTFRETFGISPQLYRKQSQET